MPSGPLAHLSLDCVGCLILFEEGKNEVICNQADCDLPAGASLPCSIHRRDRVRVQLFTGTQTMARLRAVSGQLLCSVLQNIQKMHSVSAVRRPKVRPVLADRQLERGICWQTCLKQQMLDPAWKSCIIYSIMEPV